MFEQLLSAGMSNDGKYFPDSGPGPKTLINGDKNLGYFGKVSGKELYEFNEFDIEHNVTGTKNTLPAAATFQWYKFIRKETIIYVASNPIKLATWNNVYNAGYIYGVDGNGVYPTATPTNQSIQVVREDYTDNRFYYLRVRSLVGHQDEPYTNVGTTAVAASEMGSNEIDDFFPIIRDLTYATSALGISNNQLSISNLVQNTNSNNVLQHLTRTITTGVSILKTASTGYWRPVLELIPLDKSVFGPVEIRSTIEGTHPPYAINGAFVNAIMAPSNVYGEQANIKQPELLTAVFV